MKLHNLRDFVTVARCGGIRAAARELQLSQPALTKSIRQLEDDLGTPLFERTARGATINAFGQAFLKRAQAALNEIERARDEVAQLRGSSMGNVTVAVSSVASLSLSDKAFGIFRKRYESASVTIHEYAYSTTLKGLRDGSIDFAIGPKPAESLPDDFALEILFENDRRVVGRTNHPLHAARSLSSLKDALWIITGVVGPKDAEMAEIFQIHGVEPPRSLIRCESLIALLALLSNSDALAFLPRQWVESPVTSSVLCAIPIEELIPGPPTCLIRRAGLPLTPAAQALADAFLRAAGYYSARALPVADEAVD